MKAVRIIGVGLVLICVILIAGCTSPYKVTQDLEQPIDRRWICQIGDIVDELPADMERENKPTAEKIQNLKVLIREELMKKELFSQVDLHPRTSKYLLSGSVLDYKKGSGFLRFLFGAWAGSAKLTVFLSLEDRETGEEVFAGNFLGVVTSEFESGDATFKYVAKNFAKALDKKLKKLEKLQESELTTTP